MVKFQVYGYGTLMSLDALVGLVNNLDTQQIAKTL